jgi:hypothetical protein
MDKLPQRGLKEPIIISEKIANNYLQRGDFKFSEKGKPAEKASPPTTNSNTPNSPGVNTDTTTPAVTTATNDVNTAPSAATTTTQAAPAESWVPGSVYVSGNVVGPAGTALWEVNRAQQQGFFYWDVTDPNGSVSTGSPSSLVNNVINDKTCLDLVDQFTAFRYKLFWIFPYQQEFIWANLLKYVYYSASC